MKARTFPGGILHGRPEVSVVIPAFNSAWSIRDTLRSALHQTLADIEVIVVNDGSTDALPEVVAPIAAGDGRVRVVTQANAGLAAARNRGLREARADFVAFIDADDLWHPAFLQKVLAALRADPAAPFGYALLLRTDVDNRVIPTPRWHHVPRHDFIGILEVNTVGNGSASVFRRAAIEAAGGFDETLRARGAQGAEDWKLALRLARRHAPALVAEQLVAYRLVPGGMSQSRPDLQLHGITTVMEDIRAEFPEIPDRHFRNARTMMNGWLLPTFLAPGRRGRILPMLWQSYGLNPLWFLSRDLRAIHWHKLAAVAAGLAPRKHLSEIVEDGRRPFAFLGG